MNKENKKIKEPYTPEDTPTPPHNIEPNSERERQHPVEYKSKSERKPGEGTRKESDKQHLLSEETDIKDETTI